METNKESEQTPTVAKDDKLLRKDDFQLRKDSQKSIKSDKINDTKSLPSNLSKENKENEIIGGATGSPKVPKKFINNWRQACDKTKDKTKELLKKWRTLPEHGQSEDGHQIEPEESSGGSMGANVEKGGHNWSVHVWTTWVKRFPSGDETEGEGVKSINLTQVQRIKFSNFFTTILDLDRDDVISIADFDGMSERLRHFADWSENSTEFNRLKEVQWDFVKTFLLPEDFVASTYCIDSLNKKICKEQRSLDEWLQTWSDIVTQSQCFQQLPLWLQYLPKVFFNAINKSGSGTISRDELSAFYSSVLGLTSTQVGACIDEAYSVLTSRGEHPLQYPVYRLAFANFIFARFPNGPGEYLFSPKTGLQTTTFPIDYKALCAPPSEIEQYSPELKSNRRSVIV